MTDTGWFRILLNPIIEDLTERRIATLKQAKARDATGKSDAHEWYERSDVYEKAVMALEALIPKKKETYIL